MHGSRQNWNFFERNKNKNKFFPCNISIPAGLQHNRQHRRLCMGPPRIEMHKEFFDLEFYVTDFSFKGLVSSRYLGLEVLNILVLDFGWMQ
jgi:hypothetical protein